jgi:hypothetical protein
MEGEMMIKVRSSSSQQRAPKAISDEIDAAITAETSHPAVERSKTTRELWSGVQS